MKTLNEQIERLKELIRKCYGVVASKNGIVPEVGERTMANLPDAIASTHDTLEELTITANGEYTPSEGVDGFSKVVAEFDISSLPKVKVRGVRLGNRWTNVQTVDLVKELNIKMLDFSNLNNLSYFLQNNMLNITQIEYDEYSIVADLRFIDTSKVTAFDYSLANIAITYNGSSTSGDRIDAKLKIYIDISGWDFTKATNDAYMLYIVSNSTCYLGASNREFVLKCIGTKVPPTFAPINRIFPQLQTSLVGDTTIEEIIENDLYVLEGLSNNIRLGDPASREYIKDRGSVRALINGVADRSGLAARTISVKQSTLDLLTQEDIAIATAKNWSITTY